MNLPPITTDDRTHPHKIARYTPDLLSVDISVASENSVSALITPSDLARLFLLPSDDPNPLHSIFKYKHYHDKVIKSYCWRNHNEKYATKRKGSIYPCALIKIRNFITVMGFSGLIHREGLASCNINIIWNKDSVDCCVCLPSIFTLTVELVLCLFSSCSIYHSL